MRWVSSGWFPVGGLGLAFALASAASSPAQARAGFTAGSSIGRAVAAAVELGASTGVCVLDERGEVAFEHAAAELFAPASNMKVLTAAAVLRGLGSEHRFVTRFELAEGLLVVRASGDPNWITHTVHAPAAAFGEVVAELQRRGVVALRGIRLDPGSFTGAARPASWPQNQLHTYYCAPTGAFVLDQGTFALRIDPAGRRDRALVRFDGPLVGPPLRGDIELVARRGVSTCGAIDRDDHVLVRGDLSRSSAPVRIQTAVADPAVWFERSLRDLLARAGIALRADAAAPPDGPVHEVMTTLA
ncbi:MAG: D-alanyl-D-alanine carboxypeptidase, partial [Planctomycetes bacterium]|nr:D-alanyl-D-alanine carboxypeptidase [Planctomycetota bacterium]